MLFFYILLPFNIILVIIISVIIKESDVEEKNLLEIKGTVDSVTYKNEDTGFTVFVLDLNGEPVTVVCETFSINEGEEVRLYGKYVNHPQYGSQFKAELCEVELPNTVNTIFKYLASGSIKGIGPSTARRIVDKFGDKALDIIEKTPEVLAEVKGISEKKAKEIGEEFQKIFGLRTVMTFFAKYGINLSESIKIFKVFGLSSVDVITNNPYLLCGIDFLFDFYRVDIIAKELGFESDAYLRVSAGVKYILLHNASNGHTCIPIEKVLETASALTENSRKNVDNAVKELLSDDEIVVAELGGEKFVFLSDIFKTELFISERLIIADSLMSGAGSEATSSLKKSVLRQIEDQEKKLGFQYDDLQREAILKAATEPVLVLTGGPGTGKTTTINGMIRYFDFLEKKILLAAPTGRAAQRLSEVTGKEAKTIHRLLEVEASSNKFKHNENNKLDCDVLILDEVSMIDINLFKHLLSALKTQTKIILVGDADQLPSVGAGNILNDLITSGMISSVCLNKVFRQAAQSLIVTNAHNIINGNMPDLESTDNDFFFIHAEGNLMRKVSDLYRDRLPKAYGYDPFDDIQIISPSKKGRFGTYAINEFLRDSFNPSSEDKSEVKIKSVILREGDKVIQTRNNYDIVWKRGVLEGTGVFNGDIGCVVDINKKEQVIYVSFDDRIALFTYDDAEDLELAYAITVHKSQGSEYNAVILVLGDFFDKLFYRNLLYTAVTRAKKQLIILGTEEKIKRMVDNNRKSLRYTGLKYFLTGDFLVFPEL